MGVRTGIFVAIFMLVDESTITGFTPSDIQSMVRGYNGELSQNIALLPDEVLASCPHCHSLLAVQPLNLSADERCPKCNFSLVLEESLALYGEQE